MSAAVVFLLLSLPSGTDFLSVLCYFFLLHGIDADQRGRGERGCLGWEGQIGRRFFDFFTIRRAGKSESSLFPSSKLNGEAFQTDVTVGFPNHFHSFISTRVYYKLLRPH